MKKLDAVSFSSQLVDLRAQAVCSTVIGLEIGDLTSIHQRFWKEGISISLRRSQFPPASSSPEWMYSRMPMYFSQRTRFDRHDRSRELFRNRKRLRIDDFDASTSSHDCGICFRKMETVRLLDGEDAC